MRRKLFGSEHPAVAGSLNTLGGLLETQRKLSDAETAYREALAIRRKRFGNDHPDVASSLATLGHLLGAENQPAEAESLLHECLDVRQKKLPDDWLTFNTQSLLGGSLFAQKKYAEAEPLLLAGYQGMKEREDKIARDSKVRVKEALHRLVQLYDETGRADRATELSTACHQSRRIAPSPGRKRLSSF